ncbi:hypothetical protein P4W48_004052 [Salmonella enterica]|nr:hypothetical protein [Salmonella enterica]EFS3370497.1 hypothetical protein [Salmonella enterica]EGS4024359.1 hypothetical protein [Salmonella enterica]EHT4473678.1 hypothetical protein [Salmonella enterica]EKM9605743.1 hypothetical protein [Salmonella enterica]
MSVSHVIKAAVSGLLLLAVDQALAAPQDLPIKSISVPAYNMITDSLQAIAPTIDGKLNDFAMQLICALARGDKSQQEVDTLLKQQGVDATKLPKNGSVVSLLINGHKEQQQMTCAVYLATSLFEPVNNGIYLSKQQAGAKAGKEKKFPDWNFWKSDKKEEPTSQTEQVVFNQTQFLNDAQFKMAVVQATAQMYAIIAENIQDEKNTYWADYQRRIASIVYNYAPEYLRKISIFYKSGVAKPLIPVNVSLNSFTVANEAGDVLTQQPGIVMFTSKGVPWFGSGKILGKEYFSDVMVINDAQAKVQPQTASEENDKEPPVMNSKKSSNKK